MRPDIGGIAVNHPIPAFASNESDYANGETGKKRSTGVKTYIPDGDISFCYLHQATENGHEALLYLTRHTRAPSDVNNDVPNDPEIVVGPFTLLQWRA